MMRATVMSSVMRKVIVLTVVALMSSSVAGAAGQALKITAPENTYAHLYRAFPASQGQELSVEVSMRVDAKSGGSWTPSVFLYWSPTAFLGFGHQYTNEFRFNTQGMRTAGRTDAGLTAGQWVDVKIALTASQVLYQVRPKGGEWKRIAEYARPENLMSLPAELILGKGFGNNTATYPKEHLDNPYTTLGAPGTSYMDNLIVTVDGKQVLADTFDSLNGWQEHRDASTEPAFALVSEDAANEPFPVPATEGK